MHETGVGDRRLASPRRCRRHPFWCGRLAGPALARVASGARTGALRHDGARSRWWPSARLAGLHREGLHAAGCLEPARRAELDRRAQLARRARLARRSLARRAWLARRSLGRRARLSGRPWFARRSSFGCTRLLEPLGEVSRGQDRLRPFADRLRTAPCSGAQHAPLSGFHVRREIRLRGEAHAARERGRKAADAVGTLTHLAVERAESLQHAVRTHARANGGHGCCLFA